MGTTDNQQKIQDNYKNIDDTDAGKLKTLIENVGIDKLNLLLNDLSKVEKISPKQTKKENKNYKNKELIFDDEDCCIYTRGDTKGGIYYFRLYDKKQQKPLFKSLKTTNRDSALNQAKSLYIDYKGKLERGESLRNIDTLELLKLHDEWNKNRISNITHKGITKDTYKVRVQFLKNWKQFIQEKNLLTTQIHKIKPREIEGFCNWLKDKPKETALHTGKLRSYEYINNNVNEITKMYYQSALKPRFISSNLIPQFERLSYDVDDTIKRSIFDEDDYDFYFNYLKNVYITKKHNPNLEEKDLLVRKIFYQFLFIMSNCGCRSKELLTLKLNDINFNLQSYGDKINNDCVEITIRKEVSKTGKSRKLIAPVKKKINNLLKLYKKLNINHEINDFIFINPNSKLLKPYGRQTFYKRMKETLVSSGLQEKLDKKEMKISLYSMRHQYVYWRLKYGKVKIQTLAANIGSSTKRIEDNYGHIKPIEYAEELVANQNYDGRNKKPNEVIPELKRIVKILQDTGTDINTYEPNDY